MSLRDKKIIISATLAVLLLIVFLGGYWTLEKEGLTLIVKGEEIKVHSFKNSIKEVLLENNIEYDDDDEISPSVDTKLEDYMTIKVVDVNVKQLTEYEDIEYETKIIEDNNLEKGKTKIEQDGENGKKELSYKLTYHDGELVDKALVSEAISKDVVDKVVKKGIKEEVIVASRGESSRSGNGMKVVATAYAGDGITSTGTVPKWGTIAVDPSVIPYGTKVYIPQFGMTFVAEDCGGAIKGNKIDIFMGSESEAYSWGRRTIDIVIN
ncbi:DUF348 domain-containing protein [Romboutsia weinsteinii]|uniref:DUF348 domain-containing protein n=1 Tax=Romboutsia weinsteinii TaxID=2020949 RepID=A0A371J6M7_9FIRM|nr:3D domain-containing protein [Romboutsia weinsteinii]RDY28394.1 DUF348 domain-containing protein [Romboutsia weinsteinii]